MTWLPLFWLIACLLIMFPLKQWINVHLQGLGYLVTGNLRVTVWLYWLIFLPGTFVHELSHWLMAKLLLVRTHGLELWPRFKADGAIQMGAVGIDKTDPVRHSLIGIAPLLFGTGAVLLLGQWQLTDLLDALGRNEPSQFLRTSWAILSTPLSWLWLYLIFNISNGMFPSSSDRDAWPVVIGYAILILAGTFFIGLPPVIPLQTIFISILQGLAFTFTITIIVDLIFIALIASLETILLILTGRRILY